MIEEERVEKAVWFLAGSSKDYGAARGHQAYCDANLRRVKALQMLENGNGGVADREARAYASLEYKAAMEELENAVARVETLRAQREGAVMLIET